MRDSGLLLQLFWLPFLIGAIVKGKRTKFTLPVISQVAGACLMSVWAAMNWAVLTALPPPVPRQPSAWITAWWSIQGFVLCAGLLSLGIGYLVESLRIKPEAGERVSLER